MKAFPHTYDQIIDGHVATCTNYGMDLRDWFAGLAMQTLINQEMTKAAGDFHLTKEELITGLAYHYADLMMREREE